MKKLNIYLLKEFLSFFIGSLLLFVILVTIAELSAKLNYYVQNSDRMKYFIIYHLARIPHNIYYLFPISLMFSSTYVLGNFVKNKEMIAIQNSGISLFKFSTPMFIIVVFLCLGLVFFWEFVASHTNKISFEADRTARGESTSINSGSINIFGANNYVYFIDDYYYQDKYMTNVVIMKLAENQGVQFRISTPYVQWYDDERKWYVENGILVNFERDGDVNIDVIKHYPLEVIERPDHFKKRPHLDSMSLSEERELIKLQKEVNINTNKLETDFHYRISYCFSGFIIVLLASLFCKFSTHSVLVVSLVLVIVVALLYYSILMLFRSLGDGGVINPLIAAWIPNIVFAVLCRIAFKKFY